MEVLTTDDIVVCSAYSTAILRKLPLNGNTQFCALLYQTILFWWSLRRLIHSFKNLHPLILPVQYVHKMFNHYALKTNIKHNLYQYMSYYSDSVMKTHNIAFALFNIKHNIYNQTIQYVQTPYTYTGGDIELLFTIIFVLFRRINLTIDLHGLQFIML